MRWRTGSFDIVLADHHMPVMDGEEMVRKLREEERDRNAAHPTPVLGLSADSRETMEGIDARLLKPIETAELGRAIERFVTPRTTPVLDDAVLREVCGDDTEIAGVLREFDASVAADAASLEAALAAGNAEDARRLAHRIVGVARTVGAGSLGQAA